MGSSNSAPRKLTLDNPNDATIIKVTENVVDRLQDGKQHGTTVPFPQTAVGEPAVTHNIKNNVDKDTIYITSHEIKDQIEKAIKDNDTYWENRLAIFREGYKKINAELKDGYDKAVADVSQSLGKRYSAPVGDDLESSQLARHDVFQCYNSNTERPLLCHNQVKKFTQCVSNQTNVFLQVK